MLFIAGKWLGLKKPMKKAHLFLFLAAGASGFGVYLMFFNLGIQSITSATSSIIVATAPVMTAVAASLLYKERISPIGIIALLGAFAGVTIVILWEGVLSINVGALWTLAAAALLVLYNLLSRRLTRMGYQAIDITTYGLLSGALLLLPFAGESIDVLSRVDAMGLVYLLALSVFPRALGYYFFGRGFQVAEKVTDVTNYMFVTPLFASVMGFLMLGETLNLGTALGGAVIIGSIVIFNFFGKKA